MPAGSRSSKSTAPTTSRPPRNWPARGSIARRSSFVMNVKAYSLLTGHPTRPASLWRDLRDELPDDVAAKRNLYAHHLEPDALDEVWSRFVDALRPLVKAGKLGAVLMQYPPWFVPKRDNREELARMRERMGDLPVCVELRAPTWFRARDRARTVDLLPRPPALTRRSSTRRRLRSCRRCSRSRRRPRRRAVPRSGRRHLGRADRHCSRAVQLPVLEAAAPAVGEEARAARGRGARGPRAHEQLLPGPRRAQRRRAAGDARLTLPRQAGTGAVNPSRPPRVPPIIASRSRRRGCRRTAARAAPGCPRNVPSACG